MVRRVLIGLAAVVVFLWPVGLLFLMGVPKLWELLIAMALGCLLGIGVAKRDEEGLRIWPKSKAGTPKRR